MARDLHENACIFCHRRKVKCDRLFYSCSACLKVDLPCRYRSKPSLPDGVNGITTNNDVVRRKPRGPYKKGKTEREKELEDIAQNMTRRCEELEMLITNPALLDSYSAPATDASEAFTVSPISRGHNVRRDSTFVRTDFAVGTEGQNKRTPSSHCGELLSSSMPSDFSQLAKQHCLADEFYAEPFYRTEATGSLSHPPYTQIFELWHIYMIRVDPITKLIHCPSFSEQLSKATRRPETVNADMHALMFSIYFASINALSNDEVIDRFNESKEVLLARYTQGMQTTLAYLDALQRPCIGILQALVLHAVCLHPHNDVDHDSFAKTFRLAIHVAQLLGLDSNEQASHSPLEIEIRRRCWWTLCRMRQHFIQELGSTVDKADLVSDVLLPLNANDIDLSPTADHMPKAREAISDMSCFLVTLELTQLSTKVQDIGNASTSLEVDPSRRNELEELNGRVKKLERDFLRHCDASRPFDWFLLLCSKAMLSPIEIIMREQPEAVNYGLQATSSHLFESKEDTKFSLRLDVVECWHILKTNEKLKPWSWFSRNFQAAVTVGDVCAELAKRPISVHSDRAYALIDLISRG